MSSAPERGFSSTTCSCIISNVVVVSVSPRDITCSTECQCQCASGLQTAVGNIDFQGVRRNDRYQAVPYTRARLADCSVMQAGSLASECISCIPRSNKRIYLVWSEHIPASRTRTIRLSLALLGQWITSTPPGTKKVRLDTPPKVTLKNLFWHLPTNGMLRQCEALHRISNPTSTLLPAILSKPYRK